MTSLAVATWNVLADCYLTPDLYPRTPARLLLPGARTAPIVGELFRLVETLRLDAFCLQEVHGSLLDELHSATLPRVWQVFGSREANAARDQCIVLLCGKWKLASHDRVPFVQAPENVAQRLVLLNGLAAAVLYNTHFQWAPDNGRLTRAQAGELASWVGRESHPTIVAGDLNSTLESTALQHLVGAGLADLHPYESLRTADFSHTGPLRLDYILVRGARGRPVAASDIVMDGSEPLPGWRCPSDHLPLAGRLFVSPPPCATGRRQPSSTSRVH